MGLFTLSGGLSDEEIALGTPDATEAKNLEHHVARCAYRYRLFTKRQSAQGQDIAHVKYLMFVLIGLIALTNQPMREFLSWFVKILS